jgi:hypothetical protein
MKKINKPILAFMILHTIIMLSMFIIGATFDIKDETYINTFKWVLVTDFIFVFVYLGLGFI